MTVYCVCIVEITLEADSYGRFVCNKFCMCNYGGDVTMLVYKLSNN